MSRYFPGFNSIYRQQMELSRYEEHCTGLGNILAYPGSRVWGGILPCTSAQKKGCKVKIFWIYLVINQIPGEKGRQKKLGSNNSTKIDNPIFGALHEACLITP